MPPQLPPRPRCWWSSAHDKCEHRASIVGCTGSTFPIQLQWIGSVFLIGSLSKAVRNRRMVNAAQSRRSGCRLPVKLVFITAKVQQGARIWFALCPSSRNSNSSFPTPRPVFCCLMRWQEPVFSLPTSPWIHCFFMWMLEVRVEALDDKTRRFAYMSSSDGRHSTSLRLRIQMQRTDFTSHHIHMWPTVAPTSNSQIRVSLWMFEPLVVHHRWVIWKNEGEVVRAAQACSPSRSFSLHPVVH